MNGSAFAYPPTAQARRHGPRGYTDYATYKPWLRDDFAFRCVYCLCRERWYPAGDAAFGVDHLVPQSQAPERVCDYDNLLYACNLCNSFKRASSVPDPCAVAYGDLLRVRDDGRVEGLTADGSRLIDILALNDSRLTEFRQQMLATLRLLAEAGVTGHPRLAEWLGYPDDLPDLALFRPPAGNSRPEGVNDSHFARRQRAELPRIYY